ncbi:MAG: winged helix-turn-helix transcriptional regulator [Alphaproteobacteria bacterium]|nr:winged helix-turn-helix transcriptional regulator [Alphaproteobacteria bacterium]
MKNPTDLTIQTWVRLVRAQQTALSSVEAALKKAGHPPLVWYDVLLELERAGADGLRPFELESALLLRQYGVSRLVERIEKAGYLAREACEDDARGQRLILTPAGRDCRREMWSTYAPAIEASVGSKLTPAQTKTLSDLLGKLMA